MKSSRRKLFSYSVKSHSVEYFGRNAHAADLTKLTRPEHENHFYHFVSPNSGKELKWKTLENLNALRLHVYKWFEAAGEVTECTEANSTK
ncbi:unnamed protein product [Rhizophagus irregularis]|nr:unnamed protein product [Rhizophagus irregularis]